MHLRRFFLFGCDCFRICRYGLFLYGLCFHYIRNRLCRCFDNTVRSFVPDGVLGFSRLVGRRSGRFLHRCILHRLLLFRGFVRPGGLLHIIRPAVPDKACAQPGIGVGRSYEITPYVISCASDIASLVVVPLKVVPLLGGFPLLVLAVDDDLRRPDNTGCTFGVLFRFRLRLGGRRSRCGLLVLGLRLLVVMLDNPYMLVESRKLMIFQKAHMVFNHHVDFRKFLHQPLACRIQFLCQFINSNLFQIYTPPCSIPRLSIISLRCPAKPLSVTATTDRTFFPVNRPSSSFSPKVLISIPL